MWVSGVGCVALAWAGGCCLLFAVRTMVKSFIQQPALQPAAQAARTAPLKLWPGHHMRPV
jgi:hypothetical protein